MPNGPDTTGVTVLTLTYGDRSALLAQMIAGVAAEGVRRVMVLANGLDPDPAANLQAVAQAAQAEHGVTVTVYDSATNLGSAAGYARLIRAAADDPAVTGVWLLDDDNCPRAGSLAQMLRQSAQHGGAAVSGVRTDRRYLLDAAAGLPTRPLLAGEVFGTDLRHLAGRIVRRITGRRQSRSAPDVAPRAVPYGRVPYGGLYVPAALLASVAPPKEDFVIYADDYEYSERLAQAGGLYLVGGALIDDLEASWNASGAGDGAGVNRAISQSARLAGMPADFRLYYAVRNTVWLDVRRAAAAGAAGWLWLNMAAFVLPVMARAALQGRWANIRTLRHAIQDARTNSLGRRPEYPLP